MSVRKGDMVVVKVGDDASKSPRKVLHIVDGRKIVVEGVNRVYRHVKKGHPKSPQGGRLSVEKPIDKSNVAVWCDQCKVGRRTSISTQIDGVRRRCCANCKKEI